MTRMYCSPFDQRLAYIIQRDGYVELELYANGLDAEVSYHETVGEAAEHMLRHAPGLVRDHEYERRWR